jgi:DUF4097 and DUF4098 domain-containing protein YvlB
MRHVIVVAALAALLAGCGFTINTGTSFGGSFADLPGSAEKTEEATFEIRAGDTIDASTEFGAVRLRVDEKATPGATAKFTVRAKTDEEAKRVLGTWKLVATRSGSTVTIRADGERVEADTGGAKIKIAPSVELDVVVPASVAARATSSSGDVSATGAFSGAVLSTSFGKVSVTGTRGDVDARTSSGAVEVSDVTGSRVDAQSSFGAVRLSKVTAARVVAKSSSGEVTCEEGGEGEYELTTSFGGVRLRGGKGSARAQSSSGRVTVSDFDGKVVAHSDFGGVEVAGVLTVADATSNSGAVVVEARAGSKAESRWTVTSSFGAVTLRVPDDFACELTIGTDFGSLAADHPGLGRGPDKGAKEMRAKVGAGGEPVILHSNSGAARFERSGR